METKEHVELYRKHRPASLKEVVGHSEPVKILQGMIEISKVPHVLLLSGPSGVGKTTIARILKQELGCGDMDFHEINAAESRGIDTVREIQNNMGLAPWSGSCRMWLIDEAHKLTNDAQTAFLKTLEDTPQHVYFILCTTDPDKLIKTVRGRCTRIDLKAIPSLVLYKLVTSISEKEGWSLSPKVVQKIVDVSDGSARETLQQLGKILVLGTKVEQEQLAAIQGPETERAAFDVVKALIWERPKKWPELAALLSTINEGEDWEGIRRMVLSLATKEMLKAGPNTKRAFSIVQTFGYDWFSKGKAGLVECCYDLFGRD